MRKKLILSVISILFFLIGSIEVKAHKQWMHQYITREAFTLLEKSFPGQLQEMSQYVGNNETISEEWYWSKSVGAGKIVSGAWIEDEYDVVFHYGLYTKRPNFEQDIPDWILDILDRDNRKAYTSITHFWNADHYNPHNDTFLHDTVTDAEFFWSYYCPNAFTKMKKYQIGNYNFRWVFNDQFKFEECTYGSWGYDYQFIRLENLYKSIGTINAVARLPIDLVWISTSCPELSGDGIWNKKLAYEILGRMSHLLQDMSVPAHVHCNAHAGRDRMYSDHYENNELNYNHPTAEEIWDNGNGEAFINPYQSVAPYDDPIYFLMYFMNQISDHYADGKTNGDNNYDSNCPFLSEIIPNLGVPTTTNQINDQNCRLMHSKLLSNAIRATAGLMYWFAWETGQLKNNTTNGSLSDHELWQNIHTLTGNVTVPSGITLKISPGSQVYIPAGKKITVQGTLIAEGTSSQPITFDKSGSSKWWGIKFEDSSDDDDCILEHCNIQNASYGAYCYNASPVIIYCNINNNTTGIYKAYGTTPQHIFNNDIGYNSLGGVSLAYASNSINVSFYDNDVHHNSYVNFYCYNIAIGPDVYGNKIRNSSYNGMNLYSATAYLDSNFIYDNNGYGLYCNNSSPELAYSYKPGKNVVAYNGSYGVYIDASSQPVLGNPYPNGQNSYYSKMLMPLVQLKSHCEDPPAGGDEAIYYW
jgi:hypothetical protein